MSVLFQPRGPLRIRPSVLAGTIQAPASKSITHRHFLLAAQATRPCQVDAPLMSQDTMSTLACLRALGARATQSGGAANVPASILFHPAPLQLPAIHLDCGNSGTTLRLLTATAARLGGPVMLTGDASLRARPNQPLLNALGTLGVRVEIVGGRAPLRVHGPLRSGLARLPPNCSSQFASSLLLSLPFVAGDSTLALAAPIASRPYLDVTLASAAQAGLRYDTHPVAGGIRIGIPGGQSVSAARLRVPGDWSSAAFPLVGAALTVGTVTVEGLDPRDAQGDRAIVDLLRGFGADVEVRDHRVTCRGASLTSPGTVDVAATPDLFPALAVLAAAGNGTTTFVGGAALREKETDRIAAMAAGLSRMGIKVQERPDGLVVEGGRLEGATLASQGDHRVHMAFALAGLVAWGGIVVDGAETAAVSYPSFHADLARLGAALEAA